MTWLALNEKHVNGPPNFSKHVTIKLLSYVLIFQWDYLKSFSGLPSTLHHYLPIASNSAIPRIIHFHDGSHLPNYPLHKNLPFRRHSLCISHGHGSALVLSSVQFPRPPKILKSSPMENFPYNSSYPDSVNSSPRSREIDLENSSWDEPISSANYKVKFMCSYGGKIHPRPHDNQLTYVGGDTKIFVVDRNTKYSSFISKLSSLCDASEVCFKYQLPGEDLDALISVTNDEDLEHMMLEYDRLHRSPAKPARLRLFIFPLNVNTASGDSFGSDDPKSVRQWFVDALNSVQLNQSLEDSSTPSATAETEAKKDPDFLFGLDKGHPQTAKLDDPLFPVAPTIMVGKGFSAGPEERHVIGEPVVPAAEFQRQIQEFQRMQISNHEQGVFSRKFDDYYQEKAPPPPQPQPQTQPQPSVPMTNPTAYWKERQELYPAGTNEQPVYLIQTPAGVYHASAPAMRPVTGQVSQPYYGVQRMVPEVYREQQVYNAMVPPVSSTIIQQPKMGGAYTSEGIGLVRPPAQETGYGQVGYDGTGRQVYYAAASGLMQAPPYTAVPPVAGGMDVRQSGGALNQVQDGKIMGKTSHAS